MLQAGSILFVCHGELHNSEAYRNDTRRLSGRRPWSSYNRMEASSEAFFPGGWSRGTIRRITAFSPCYFSQKPVLSSIAIGHRPDKRRQQYLLITHEITQPTFLSYPSLLYGSEYGRTVRNFPFRYSGELYLHVSISYHGPRRLRPVRA